MAEITIFELAFCPYCRKAHKALKALRAENPAYARVEVAWIEESRYPELARARDYYYVPAVFVGEEKLYEAKPLWSRAEAKQKLDAMFAALTRE